MELYFSTLYYYYYSMKIVVKVGTQSILSEQGSPIESIIYSIVEQIAELQKQGHHIVLVSSGAVGLGRNVARNVLDKEYGASIGEKQLLASLGQHALINIYSQQFQKHGFLASQLLLTKQDFHTRQHYLNISRLIQEILQNHNIIPIINENDSVAIEELMFTDNDELAGLIAAQINADKLIILSNVEGVFTKNPVEADAELLATIDPEISWPDISTAKSSLGRGGMISKLTTAKKLSKLGVVTHIASINQADVIKRIVNNESIGSKILPAKKQSNIKRWVAFSAHQKTGEIVINARLQEILLQGRKVISILPIGIEHINTPFEKGDIVAICNSNHDVVAIGIARYDSGKLQEYLGQQNKPVFIHYDHLHIF